MEKSPPYDPGAYACTLYVFVEIVYEPRNEPGARKTYVWGNYDFAPKAPALNAFLKRFAEERGTVIGHKTVGAWNVDHRATNFGSATITLH